MAASTSSEPSTGDPPLYMSGRHFVEIAGHSTNSRSSRATSENPHHMSLAHPPHAADDHQHLSTFHGLTESGETPLGPHATDGASGQARVRLQSLGADIPNVVSGVMEAMDHIAGESVTDSEAAGYEFNADEDAELKASVEMLNKHRELQRRENEELRMMQLTAQQLQEMTGNDQDMCTIEYFSTKYFSDEARKVWSERAAGDASPDAKRTVRLFGGESAILAQARATREAKAIAAAAAGHGGSAAESLALSHPLLHRRAMRNEERRAVFRQAALERQAANEAPSMRNTSASGVSDAQASLAQKSVYSPQRDLFGRNRTLVHFEGRAAAPPALEADQVAATALDSASAASFGNQTASVTASTATAAPHGSTTVTSDDTASTGALTPAGPPKPQTLSEMLAEQKRSLADMKTSDDDVYRPILDAFYRYDAAVQEKLGRLLERVGVSADDSATPPE